MLAFWMSTVSKIWRVIRCDFLLKAPCICIAFRGKVGIPGITLCNLPHNSSLMHVTSLPESINAAIVRSWTLNVISGKQTVGFFSIECEHLFVFNKSKGLIGSVRPCEYFPNPDHGFQRSRFSKRKPLFDSSSRFSKFCPAVHGILMFCS